MICGLDHINISTDKLAQTRAFFIDVLGLSDGWRPDFGVPGAWLYSGERAVVHLVERDAPRTPSRQGALDHFAFAIDDFEDAATKLAAHGVAFQSFDVPGSRIRQMFIEDLNGVTIELNYRPPEDARR
ncbi:MAG TPA: VOC family protein [Caulobacteraceae bacterium]